MRLSNLVTFSNILVSLCLIILVLVLQFNYVIYQQAQQTNKRLDKIQHNLDKYFVYMINQINSIKTMQKQQQRKIKQQKNKFSDFFAKITATEPTQKENSTPHANTYMQIDKNTNENKKYNLKPKVTPQGDYFYSSHQSKKPFNNNFNNEKTQKSQKTQLLTLDQIFGIAAKIIEKQNQGIQLQNQQNKINQKQIQQIKQKIQLNGEKENKQNTVLAQQTVRYFQCQLQKENLFQKNFILKLDQLKIKKTRFTHNFQSVFCQNQIVFSSQKTLPNEPPSKNYTSLKFDQRLIFNKTPKIWQTSIKIINTLKGWIYIGLVNGQKNQTQNITSLHISSHFYGYSGYSGRIYEAGSKTHNNFYELLKNNDILKIKLNFQTSTILYQLNQHYLYQSRIDQNLCQKGCRFVVLLYNQGDQVQFLTPVELNHTYVVNQQILNDQMVIL